MRTSERKHHWLAPEAYWVDELLAVSTLPVLLRVHPRHTQPQCADCEGAATPSPAGHSKPADVVVTRRERRNSKPTSGENTTNLRTGLRTDRWERSKTASG
eukprot:SAG11_NODE_18738_length_482_cov_1.741514_1_plen_101_part_00